MERMREIGTAISRLNRIDRLRAFALGMTGLGVLPALLLAGCVSYTNVPVPESAPAFKSANHTQSIMVVSRALENAITKHPVSGPYAINLPVGTTPESFERIISELPEGAMIPFEGMSSDVPVYHIGRIWIRASDAKVDVVYPFQRADGTGQDQSVTIWLSGGVRAWRVHREQYWASGTIPTPPIYVPIIEVQEADDESAQGLGIDEAPDGSAGSTEALQEAEAFDAERMPEPEASGDGYREVPVGSKGDDS